MSAYFPPEIGAPANRAYEFARRWSRRGHSVQVLTGFPNHPTGEIPAPYRSKRWRFFLRESFEGVEILRCWLIPAPNRKAWERLLNYGSFFLSASTLGLLARRPQGVVATSPHLLTGLAGWWLSRAFRVPFVLEIRDLWPESLVASGVGRESSPLIRWVGRWAAFLYARADRIVAVTEEIAETIRASWHVPADRVTVIEHGVDGTRFQPERLPGWSDGLADLNGHPVVSYIGTLGQAHGLTQLLEAAAQVSVADPEIRFLLVGEGAEKDRLLEKARELRLQNVRFLPKQPWEEIPRIINRSTLCVACLKPGETFKTVMPTKILEYLSCGKPVALAGAGHARKVLEASHGGLAVEPGDVRALASAILQLARDPDLRQRCGEQGRRYVLERFSVEARADSYLQLLEGLIQP